LAIVANIDEMIVRFPGGKRVSADFDGMTVATDQSVEDGGDESAPAPFDLFIASLATCAGVYVLGFCQKRDIPTDGIRLVQSLVRDEEKKIRTVSIQIEVPEGFPEKYHGALERVAAKCTVKKTIEAPPAFEIETVVR
jgi:ribosomal protein S12 methylthiotransferase accessory factor